MNMFYRHVILFFITWSSVWAGTKAEIDIELLNPHHWPAHYQISITPPAYHHSIIDNGVQQEFIPITIDPDNNLRQQGLVVTDITMPEGEFDHEVNATVIRKKGVIDFTLKVDDINDVSNVKSITVRYQVCNQQSNVCFRPQTLNLALDLPDITTANNTSSISAVALMLLAGLFFVATLGVYPILPITLTPMVKRARG